MKVKIDKIDKIIKKTKPKNYYTWFENYECISEELKSQIERLYSEYIDILSIICVFQTKDFLFILTENEFFSAYSSTVKYMFTKLLLKNLTKIYKKKNFIYFEYIDNTIESFYCKNFEKEIIAFLEAILEKED